MNDAKEIVVADAKMKIEPIGVIEASTRAEIDIQIATARKYPRHVDHCLRQAMTLATNDEDIAASMYYVIPRDKKKIEGPSARLAEIMGIAWTNIRTQGRSVDVYERYLTAEASSIDLENNVGYKVEVQRPIIDHYGNRYSDNMIGVTMSAAISIATRNTILKVIPMAYTLKIYREAKRVAAGDASTLVQRRREMFKHFENLGVKPKNIYSTFGISGEEDVTLDVLSTIRGVATALKEGHTTIDEAFNLGAFAATEKVSKRRAMMDPEGDGSKARDTEPLSSDDIDTIFQEEA